MIEGIVNERLEATVRLVIRDGAGGDHEIEAFVDTGFSGDLTLPRSVISALNLRWDTRTPMILGNGSAIYTDLYVAIILWDGQVRHIRVEGADTLPLVGMALIRGFHLHVEAIPNGRVVIERLPNTGG
jgi:clan AA aspartic protease